MRLIYTDEAGTSGASHETVRIVSSVIVHGDDQYHLLVGEIDRIVREKVQTDIQDSFIFHGLEVFNGGKRIKREEWSFNERLDFFKEIVSLPFIFDVPISVGIVFSGSTTKPDPRLTKVKTRLRTH